MGSNGYLEHSCPIDSIRVGERHRKDLGDLDRLTDSIEQLGLLQPITITPDRTLICGARRLEAARRLGWKTVKVWVCTGLSTRLEHLLAEEHENTLRKPLTPTEQAALYQELKALLAQDAARRQQATRFGAETGTGYGNAKLAKSSRAGSSRAKAALLVTGRKAYTTLERISELMRIAASVGVPDGLRRLAADAVAAIDRGGKVAGRHKQVINALRQHAATTGQDSDSQPEAAPPSADGEPQPAPSSQHDALTELAAICANLRAWLNRHDPADIGPALSTEQREDFQTTIHAAAAFASAFFAAELDR